MPSKPKILLDVCVAGKSDFETTFPDLKRDLLKGRVLTARGGKKYSNEISKCIKLRRLLNQLNDAGLLIRVTDENVNTRQDDLQSHIDRLGERCKRECNDPHLFALGSLTGAKFVISSDNNIGTCRRRLNAGNVPDRLYAKLTVIASNTAYLDLVP